MMKRHLNKITFGTPGFTNTGISLVIMGAVIASFSLLGCSSNGGANMQKDEKPPVVKIELVKPKTIARTIELTGSVEPTSIARIASPAEGPVRNCTVREGDQVRQGQVILTIGRKRAAEALVASVREELAREEEEARRIEQLVSSGAIPGEQLDDAKLRVSRAQAKLSQAKESIEDYRIQAPWAGLVAKVFVTDGDFVAPRVPLVEIFNPNSVVIRFAVPETLSPNISAGIKLLAKLDAYPNRNFNAIITRVYPELDRGTRTRTVEAKIVDDVALFPGLFARVSIAIKTEPNAITIPDKALLTTPQGDKIVFIVENDKASLRMVKTGVEQGHRIQILEGIKAGELVVISGNENLNDGMKIQLAKPEHSTQTGSQVAR